MWVRRTLDSQFDPKKSQFEVGHDWIGKFMPKIILKNKSDTYKLTTRLASDELYSKF